MVFCTLAKGYRLDGADLASDAVEQQCDHLFSAQDHERYSQATKELKNARSRELRDLFVAGFGTHLQVWPEQTVTS